MAMALPLDVQQDWERKKQRSQSKAYYIEMEHEVDNSNENHVRDRTSRKRRNRGSHKNVQEIDIQMKPTRNNRNVRHWVSTSGSGGSTPVSPLRSPLRPVVQATQKSEWGRRNRRGGNSQNERKEFVRWRDEVPDVIKLPRPSDREMKRRTSSPKKEVFLSPKSVHTRSRSNKKLPMTVESQSRSSSRNGRGTLSSVSPSKLFATDWGTRSETHQKQIERAESDLNQYISKFAPDEDELEKDLDVLARRQKQIDLGKMSTNYRNYAKLVPKHKRKQSSVHPRTPCKFKKLSRRNFDSMVKLWKRNLHQWAKNASVDSSDWMETCSNVSGVTSVSTVSCDSAIASMVATSSPGSSSDPDGSVVHNAGGKIALSGAADVFQKTSAMLAASAPAAEPSESTSNDTDNDAKSDATDEEVSQDLMDLAVTGERPNSSHTRSTEASYDPTLVDDDGAFHISECYAADEDAFLHDDDPL